jgi:hypothetical protein
VAFEDLKLLSGRDLGLVVREVGPEHFAIVLSGLETAQREAYLGRLPRGARADVALLERALDPEGRIAVLRAQRIVVESMLDLARRGEIRVWAETRRAG